MVIKRNDIEYRGHPEFTSVASMKNKQIIFRFSGPLQHSQD